MFNVLPFKDALALNAPLHGAPWFFGLRGDVPSQNKVHYRGWRAAIPLQFPVPGHKSIAFILNLLYTDFGETTVLFMHFNGPAAGVDIRYAKNYIFRCAVRERGKLCERREAARPF
ncbi:MAG TPA: hypothetical protein VN540_03655 [Clostridia bacterium]|nr:hypothetical protein [Clostridia bacterium]